MSSNWGLNTSLGGGGRRLLLPVVIILTRSFLRRPANVSRTIGRAGSAGTVVVASVSFCVFLLLHRDATGAEKTDATTPTEVDSGPTWTISYCICISIWFHISTCICIRISIFICISICRKEQGWSPDLQQFLTSLECCRPWALL